MVKCLSESGNNNKNFANNYFSFLSKSIILLLIGSLVTYQETLGDTAPSFISKLFNIQVFIKFLLLLLIGNITDYDLNLIKHSKTPRTLIVILFTVCIALPLSLSKKLDKLSHLSAFSIGFYFFFAFYVYYIYSSFLFFV